MRYPESYDATVADWRKKLEREHLAPRTISFYCETIHAVAELLKSDGRPVLPRQIRAEDVDFLLDYFTDHDFAIQTRKGYLSTLRKYCAAYNGQVVDNWPKYRFSHDNRPHADWLTAEQARALLACEKTAVQECVIHLELCLGLRHVEVIRLVATDIDFQRECITVLGKGSMGGKPRVVPFAQGTADVLRRYSAVRDMQIAEARKRFPVSATVPPQFVLWIRGGRLHPYSEEGYGLDKIVTLPLSDKLGFRFSNHTLRRTFGRALFRSGVAVPVIAKILGHESTDVTLRYIGVDLDDMQTAMQSYRM